MGYFYVHDWDSLNNLCIFARGLCSLFVLCFWVFDDIQTKSVCKSSWQGRKEDTKKSILSNTTRELLYLFFTFIVLICSIHLRICRNLGSIAISYWLRLPLEKLLSLQNKPVGSNHTIEAVLSVMIKNIPTTYI